MSTSLVSPNRFVIKEEDFTGTFFINIGKKKKNVSLDQGLKKGKLLVKRERSEEGPNLV